MSTENVWNDTYRETIEAESASLQTVRNLNKSEPGVMRAGNSNGFLISRWDYSEEQLYELLQEM